MKTPARVMAFGGMMAALALVIMNLGGLIPIATFVCPMLCMMILAFVVKMCGSRIGWAWYGAVAILSALMAPDKEAAAVFAFLGFYPIVKPKLDRVKAGWLLKLAVFNAAIALMYGILIHLFGMAQIAAEYQALGTIMTAVMLIMGNVIFFLLDKALTRFSKIR
ncbi:MAG: hypothetical protein IKJ99_06370 [Oscillospiraceae bacterium]|nr:hypothetical protein [Oscillospiraceae bacterium]